VVMDEILKEIQGEIPWCMLFADDIVLVGENLKAVNIGWMSGDWPLKKRD